MGNCCLPQLQEHHRRDPHRAFNRVDHCMEDAGFRITWSCVDQQVTRECYAVRPAGASGTGDGQAFGDGFATVLIFLALERLRIAWHREEAFQGEARADKNPQK
jgi:hypothetical protein